MKMGAVHLLVLRVVQVAPLLMANQLLAIKAPELGLVNSQGEIIRRILMELWQI